MTDFQTPTFPPSEGITPAATDPAFVDEEAEIAPENTPDESPFSESEALRFINKVKGAPNGDNAPSLYPLPE